MCLLLGFLIAIGLTAAGCSRGVVAVVNGHKISEDEFVTEMEKTVGKDVLRDLIDRQLLEDAAIEQGVMPTQKEIDDEVAKIKSQVGSDAAFNRELQQRNMTLEDYRDLLKMRMIVERLCTTEVKITDADAKKFFEEHKAQYSTPELVNYSLMVLKTKKEAEDVIAQLKKGADFAALTRQKSEDTPFKNAGGNVGWRPLEEVQPPPLAKTLASLKKGEVSKPLRFGNSYVVVRLDDRQAAQKPSFEEIKTQVIRDAKAAKGRRPQELIVELRSGGHVSVLRPHYEEVAALYRRVIPGEGELWPTGSPSGGGEKPAPGGKTEENATKKPQAPSGGKTTPKAPAGEGPSTAPRPNTQPAAQPGSEH